MLLCNKCALHGGGFYFANIISYVMSLMDACKHLARTTHRKSVKDDEYAFHFTDVSENVP